MKTNYIARIITNSGLYSDGSGAAATIEVGGIWFGCILSDCAKGPTVHAEGRNASASFMRRCAAIAEKAFVSSLNVTPEYVALNAALHAAERAA